MDTALRAFFDSASPRELGAAAELSAYEDMRYPHKNRVYTKTMKRCGIKKAFFTSPAAKRATAAAAVLLVTLTGVIALGGSSVGAALERFFSFIPGVGVTETVSGSDIYVLTEAAPSAGDDMITVAIKSADIRGGVLEIHYDIIPLKIDARAAAEIMNAEGIDADVATAVQIYREYGYGEYFDILEKGENGRYDLLRPHVSLTLSGEELSVSSSYVCDSEQGSFGTTNCIEKYDISRYYSGETLEALLDVGGVELPFTLTKAEKFTTEKQAYPEGSAVCSAYGTEVVCVPAWTDDLLIVELYGTDCSEYDKIKHMQGGGAGLVFASVNGELIEGTVDGEPPVMYHSDTDTGTRLAFDISGIDEEITSAIICVDNIVAVKHDDFISARISADGSVTERGGQTCEKLPQIESAEINGAMLNITLSADVKDGVRIDHFEKLMVNGEAVDTYDMSKREGCTVISTFADGLSDGCDVRLEGIEYRLPVGFRFVLRNPEGEPVPEITLPSGDELAKQGSDKALARVWSESEYLSHLEKCPFGYFALDTFVNDREEIWFNGVTVEQAAQYVRMLHGFTEESTEDGVYTARGNCGFEWELYCDGDAMGLFVPA